MTGVIYARYSSDKQQETSIEEQVERCTEYALKHGISVMRHYIDRGKSAHTNIEKRTEFLKMVRDSKTFDVLLIYKLDRFSRNEYDFAVYRRELEGNGVRIVSVTEDLPNTPEGKMMTGMLQVFSSFYSDQLSKRVKAGMVQNAKHHKVLGAIPYGYRSVEGRYEINEVEAPAIRLLFDLYAKDYPMHDILSKLKEKGYRARNGKPFGKTSFCLALRSEKYIGNYVWEDVRIEGAMPRLVDDETFGKVQRRLDREEMKRSYRKYEYMLSGKAFCSCGERLIGKSAKSGKYTYYYCEKCRKTHSSVDLEQKVADGIRNTFTDEFCLKLADTIMSIQEKQKNQEEIASLEGELKEKETELATMKRLMLKNETMFDLYKNDVKPLTEEIEDIKKRLDNITSTLSYDEVLSFIKEYQKYDTDDIALRRDLFTLFVYKVVVNGKDATLYLNALEDKSLRKFAVVVHCKRKANFEIAFL